MVKFVVVLVRRSDLDSAAFRRHFVEVHQPMAERLPGLARYAANLPAEDPNRTPPGWDAVVELWFDDYTAMQDAWASPEGRTATADLEAFCDLERSSWGLVEERGLRGAG